MKREKPRGIRGARAKLYFLSLYPLWLSVFDIFGVLCVLGG